MQKVGFTKRLWENGGSYLEICFSEFSTEQRNAMFILDCNGVEIMCFQKEWKDLSEDQQKSASELGYAEEEWDVNVSLR
jgi:hypothetical protein